MALLPVNRLWLCQLVWNAVQMTCPIACYLAGISNAGSYTASSISNPASSPNTASIWYSMSIFQSSKCQRKCWKVHPPAFFGVLSAIFAMSERFTSNTKCWQCLESFLGLKCWKQYSFQHLRCQPNNMPWGTSFELHFAQTNTTKAY